MYTLLLPAGLAFVRISFGCLQNVFAAIFLCSLTQGTKKGVVGLWVIPFVNGWSSAKVAGFFHCCLSCETITFSLLVTTRLTLQIRSVTPVLAPDHSGTSWKVMRSSMNRPDPYPEALIIWTCTFLAWLMGTWATTDLWSYDWTGMCSFKKQRTMKD